MLLILVWRLASLRLILSSQSWRRTLFCGKEYNLTPSLILRPHLATWQILILVNNRNKISTHKKHFCQNSRALLLGCRSTKYSTLYYCATKVYSHAALPDKTAKENRSRRALLYNILIFIFKKVFQYEFSTGTCKLQYLSITLET